MASGGFKDYLTFRALGIDFAIDAQCVRGVVPAEELLRFDGLPPGVAGIGSFQGKSLVVLDLCVKLSLPAKDKKRPLSLLVVSCKASCKTEKGTDELAGFHIDRVSDIVTVHRRNIQNGVIAGHGRRRRVLELRQLATADDLKFLTNTSR